MDLSQRWEEEAQKLKAELPRGEDSEADQVLELLLILVLTSLALRTAAATFTSLCCPPGDADGVLGAMQPKLLNLAVAASNVATKILGAFSHGLLAIKLVVADTPAGLPLAACIILVAANTHLLTSAAIVAHMRYLLVKMAFAGNMHLKFANVTDMWHVPVGKVCLFINAITTAVLVGKLFRHPMRLAAWLATSLGFLMWSNSSFKGIGLMGLGAWRQVSPMITDELKSVEVGEFMDLLGFPAAAPEATQDWRTLALSMLKLEFGPDDMLILRHRPALLRRAFPTHPWLRRVHGASIVLLALLSSAVPALLVFFCMRSGPELLAVEVLDGKARLHPDFVPAVHDYHILLSQEDLGEDGWHDDKTKNIRLTFDVGRGEVARAWFCCGGGKCQEAEMRPEEHSKQLTWTHGIPETQFGSMCQLSLFGLQTGRYNFKVLAVKSLPEPVVDGSALLDGMEPATWQWSQREYVQMVVVQDVPGATVSLMLKARVHPTLHCEGRRGSAGEFSTANITAVEDGWKGVLQTVSINRNSSRASWSTQLVLRSAAGKETAMVTYSFQLTVLSVSEYIKELIEQVASLQRQMALPGSIEGGSQDQLGDELDKWTLRRNFFLEQAWSLQQSESPRRDTSPGNLTFVTLGLTGTGKSELCRWMTRNEEQCKTGSEMESHTADVITVLGHAFGDDTQPFIEWIDTPGRGDTNGPARDDELWRQTKNSLLDICQDGRPIHRIAWVVNARWQRGTTERENIFRQLRNTFGFHLYKHLVIVFNHMARPMSYESHMEELEKQRNLFIQWMMKCEEEEFKWDAEASASIRKEVEALKVYGFDINPRLLEAAGLPEGLPLSAPYVDLIPPLSYPVGVDDLKQLVKDAENHRDAALQNDSILEGLKFFDPTARFGPGVLHRADATVTCGQWAVLNDVYEFVPVARVELHGEEFQPGKDKLFISPITAACDDNDNLDETKSVKEGIDILSSPKGTNKKTAFITFPLWDKGLHKRICFCEYPKCDRKDGWRFSQTANITVPYKSCSRPEHKLADWKGGDPVLLVLADDNVIAMDTEKDRLRLLKIGQKEDSTDPPFVLETRIQLSCEDVLNCYVMPDVLDNSWRFLLSGKDKAFAINADLSSILFIDQDGGTLDLTMVHLDLALGSPPLVKSIVSDDKHVYFLTSSASEFCIHRIDIESMPAKPVHALKLFCKMEALYTVEMGCKLAETLFLIMKRETPEAEEPIYVLDGLSSLDIPNLQPEASVNLEPTQAGVNLAKACMTQATGVQALAGFKELVYVGLEDVPTILTVHHKNLQCRKHDTAHLAKDVSWGTFVEFNGLVFAAPMYGLGNVIGVLDPTGNAKIQGIRVAGVSARIVAWPVAKKICMHMRHGELLCLDMSTFPR